MPAVVVISESSSISATLQKCQFQTVAAESVAEAVALLQPGQINVDLVILDTDTLDVRGTERLKEAASDPRFNSAPVIICLSDVDQEVVRRAISLGAKDIVVKPIREKALLTRVLRNLPRRGPSVLVVDDDKDIAGLLTQVFEMDGFSVLTAHSGEEGLQAFKQAEIDAVVSDILMPGMTGVELLKKLRNINENVPVFLITGHAGSYSKAIAETVGATGYLQKPFRNADILAMLNDRLRPATSSQ